jgi:multidrug efflux system membrane fusion protein
LESAKAVLKQAQVDLGQASVRAPFDGIILEQNIDKGDYVANGDSMFSIVDLDPIEIVAFVSERKVQELALGQKAAVEFLNGDKIEGTLSYIAPAADDQTRTFRVIMSADNEGMLIRDGLTAKMKMPVKPKQAHRISPSILTLNTEGKIGVKIVNDQDIVEFTPIKILADKSDAMWVVGPPASARMITVGQEFVIEGQKVEPVMADGEGLL